MLNFEIRCPVPVRTYVRSMPITITHSTEVISGERFQNSYSIRIVISPVSGKNNEEILCFAQIITGDPYKPSDIYGHTGHTHKEGMDQPGKVANPARGQLNRKK